MVDSCISLGNVYSLLCVLLGGYFSAFIWGGPNCLVVVVFFGGGGC